MPTPFKNAMANDNEDQDSQNLNDEEDTDLLELGAEDEDFNDDAPQETPEQKIARLEEQNKKLFARIKKQKEKKADPKEQPKAPGQNFDSEAIKSELRDELRLEAQGYNEDEKQVILKASKALGISPLEAAKDDIVKGKIEQMREEIKTQNAIPSPSGKAGTKDTNSVDYYIESGEIPEDDDLADKVDAERIRRAKEQI